MCFYCLYCTLGELLCFYFEQTLSWLWHPLTQSPHLRERDGQDFKKRPEKTETETARDQRRERGRRTQNVMTAGAITPRRRTPGTLGARTPGRRVLGTLGTAGAVTQRAPGHQEGGRLERWMPECRKVGAWNRERWERRGRWASWHRGHQNARKAGVLNGGRQPGDYGLNRGRVSALPWRQS